MFVKGHTQSRGPRKPRKNYGPRPKNIKKKSKILSKNKEKDEMIVRDGNGHTVIRTSKGRFKKGVPANPNGQPKIPFTEQLKRAMNEMHESAHGKSVAEYIIEQIYESPVILSQFIRKIPQPVFDELFGVDSPDRLTIEITNYKKNIDTEVISGAGEKIEEDKPTTLVEKDIKEGNLDGKKVWREPTEEDDGEV